MLTQRTTWGGDTWIVVRRKKEVRWFLSVILTFSNTYEANSSSDNEQGPDHIGDLREWRFERPSVENERES